MAHSPTTPPRDGAWTLRVVLAGWIALSLVTASQMHVAAGQIAPAPSFRLENAPEGGAVARIRIPYQVRAGAGESP